MPQSANNPATGRWNGRAGRQGADPGAGWPTGAVNPNRPGRSGTGILRQDPRTALPPLLRKGRGTALPQAPRPFRLPATLADGLTGRRRVAPSAPGGGRGCGSPVLNPDRNGMAAVLQRFYGWGKAEGGASACLVVARRVCLRRGDLLSPAGRYPADPDGPGRAPPGPVAAGRGLHRRLRRRRLLRLADRRFRLRGTRPAPARTLRRYGLDGGRPKRNTGNTANCSSPSARSRRCPTRW